MLVMDWFKVGEQIIKMASMFDAWAVKSRQCHFPRCKRLRWKLGTREEIAETESKFTHYKQQIFQQT